MLAPPEFEPDPVVVELLELVMVELDEVKLELVVITPVEVETPEFEVVETPVPVEVELRALSLIAALDPGCGIIRV